MPLEVYHLQLSQSERIVWLIEEMGIPYNLHVFKRNPQTALAPDELKAITPYGTAPYFRDTSKIPEVALSESSAIVSYIVSVFPSAPGHPRLIRTPDDPDYSTYLQWFHYANGSLQPSIAQQITMILSGLGESIATKIYRSRLLNQLKLVDEHLAKSKWFAGEELSAADCMIMFSLSTLRGFSPVDLGPYPNILRWMKDVS
ncbi:glutathione S-transferase domain-containing protein [Truncatella angustata]|uniref:Glutathione S-transferase domain-containing protein n=1 Tax=Truncatella angustata TaxID=152316 RepID=A0A9P8USH0_9PEZI|nr:glutathione S-transferase domain-containing protein [Truncatella angustata]KAH6657524.1 glutathione S-transferase domain-containing protein [Truncatella angustata]KAH8201755.1 hypothetical protein TruAng_004107 [Truncatella angustata]